MLGFIDSILNRVTMYRLALYYLSGLVVAAFVLSGFHVLPFTPFALVFSLFTIVFVSWSANRIFAYVWRVPVNVESVYITALILFFLISPPGQTSLSAFLSLALWASVWAIASKFIFAIFRKHIFNPAAFGVVITAFFLHQSASWWVGTVSMMPFVLVGGLLLIRKLQRFDLVSGFFVFSLAIIIISAFGRGLNFWLTLQKTLLDTPILFFAFIMLTEPLTTPPTRSLRLCYEALVGLLFAPFVHVGTVYSTPELALLAGNLYSYAVSPKRKLLLALKEKIRVANGIYDFIFTYPGKFAFTPGQYLELTLGHTKSDSRGNRRYFTIASAPTESTLRFGIKFYDTPSSFKRAFSALAPGATLSAGQLGGDFTLPKNVERKIVMLAGGIGITPFRSMIKQLIDNHERRDIVLVYVTKNASEVAYKEIFDQAARKLGIKTHYLFSDIHGRLDMAKLEKLVSDFPSRTFYISGPHAMVTSFSNMLAEAKVPKHQIVTDFFPGF